MRSIPKIIFIPAIVLAGIVFALMVALVKLRYGVDLGPGLSVAAAVAILYVTLVYVRHTKELVDAQAKQYRSQQRQTHFAAVSKLWVTSLAVESSIMGAELELRDLVGIDTLLKDREESVVELGKSIDQLTQQSHQIMELIVDLDVGIETKAVEAASEIMTVSGGFRILCGLILSEMLESRSGKRDFSLDRVMVEWENPSDARDRSEVRWSELVDGKSLKALDRLVEEFRFTCRAEIKARSAALLE
jgi:hypothetical protein